MYIIIIVYFSSLHNFVMFKDICKWDLLPLNTILIDIHEMFYSRSSFLKAELANG